MLGRHDWDVEHVDVGGTAEIDWRYKMEKGALSDKQLKIAESIRRKEYKLQVILLTLLHRPNSACYKAVRMLVVSYNMRNESPSMLEVCASH